MGIVVVCALNKPSPIHPTQPIQLNPLSTPSPHPIQPTQLYPLQLYPTRHHPIPPLSPHAACSSSHKHCTVVPWRLIVATWWCWWCHSSHNSPLELTSAGGGWVGGWKNGWVVRWVGGWKNGWVVRWVGGWMGRWWWMGKWMGGWGDG